MTRLVGWIASLALLLSACGQTAVQAPRQSAPAPPVGQQSTNGSLPASVAAPASSAAAVSASPVVSAVPSAAAASSPPPAVVSPKPTPPLNPPSKRIGPLPFISQTLNNCGPASVAEVLDFYGVHRTQAQVATVLRPDLPQYGMSLFGVPFYAESVGMRTASGVSGNQQLIKSFVANGLPVIVADLVSRQETIRHFRPIDGYDDAAGYFIGSDPYLGPNHKISYADFDALWQISYKRWVVIYPPDKDNLVRAIVSQDWNHDQAVQDGLRRALARANKDAKQPWGWMDLADLQIESRDYAAASQSIQNAIKGGLPFEAHWLQLKLQRASRR